MNVKSFFGPLYARDLRYFVPKNGFFWQSEHFFRRPNTYEYKAFRADTMRVLPLIYAATQKNIHIRRGEQEEIFNELF